MVYLHCTCNLCGRIKVIPCTCVSCDPISWRTTLWVYSQEERKRDFHIYVCNSVICNPIRAKFVAEMPGESTHQIWRKSTLPIPRYNPNLHFSAFLCFFISHTCKFLAIKHECILRSNWNLVHIKGLLRCICVFWLEANEDLQSYDWFFCIKRWHAYRVNCLVET